MKHVTKMGLCLAAVLALTACSSSGNSRPNTDSNGNGGTVKPNPNPDPTVKPQAFSGHVVVVPYDGTQSASAVKSITAGANIDQLLIDGKTINLIPTGLKGKWVELADQNGGMFVGGDLSYARYGSVWRNEYSNEYVFSQGRVTAEADMPKVGQVAYAGQAMYGTGSDAGWVKGVSQFNVDFGKKTLTGSVSGTAATKDLFPTVSLVADIKGNQFEGKHNGVATSGGFYGPNAAELSGLYQGKLANGKDFGGAFGAKKQ